MGLQYRRRLPLFRVGRVEVWANLRLGLPSLSLRVGPATFNTRRGLSSVRLGKGFTYQDRDR